MKAFFVFSGQGAQAPGMGKDLYESSAAAKAIFDQADEILGYKLSEVCFNGPAEKLTETNYCQVAIYTMSCAALEAFKEKFGYDIATAIRHKKAVEKELAGNSNAAPAEAPQRRVPRPAVAEEKYKIITDN